MSATGTARPAPTAAARERQGLDAIERRLISRLAVRPHDGSSWRLLGRIRLRRDDLQGALAAFSKAVELDPTSVAARFDRGRTLLKLNQPTAAAREFRLVVQLAPESDYARKARQLAAEHGLEIESEQQQVVPAGFEVKRFDGSDRLSSQQAERRREEQEGRGFYFRMETGALHNSNVGLAPISRNLFPGTRDSLQGFVTPELEYTVPADERTNVAALFSGYFNLNEGDFREFNLQSYQPGAYVERLIVLEPVIVAPRLQYTFTHDSFEGRPFGDRQAVTFSVAGFWNSGDTSLFYWSSDFTDFRNDGIFAPVTSRDGWLHAAGISHTWAAGLRHLDSITAGVDLQQADAEGTDFAFHGVSLFGEARVPIVEDVFLELRGGWGYRNYFQFEFEPSRNEHVWQAGAELHKRLNDRLSVAGVFTYDWFDSRNVLFQAERFIYGIVLIVEN